jgi:hypothetical protein
VAFVEWLLSGGFCRVAFVGCVRVETRQLLSLPYTVRLYRTFNPDLRSVLLATVVTKPLDIYVGYRYREMSGVLIYGWGIEFIVIL